MSFSGLVCHMLDDWGRVEHFSISMSLYRDQDFPRCFVSFNTLHLVSTKARPRILLALCEWIHWWPAVSPHKGPVMRIELWWFPCWFEEAFEWTPEWSVKWEALTHWGQDKMAANFLTTFSNTFSWMKIYEFRLRFHWSLFPRVQLTIFQHWFR